MPLIPKSKRQPAPKAPKTSDDPKIHSSLIVPTAMQRSKTTQTGHLFGRLPLELRLKIYDNIIVQKHDMIIAVAGEGILSATPKVSCHVTPSILFPLQVSCTQARDEIAEWASSREEILMRLPRLGFFNPATIYLTSELVFQDHYPQISVKLRPGEYTERKAHKFFCDARMEFEAICRDGSRVFAEKYMVFMPDD